MSFSISASLNPTRADLAHLVALRRLDLDAVQWTHVMTSIFLFNDDGTVV
jgi:hypothetical protein